MEVRKSEIVKKLLKCLYIWKSTVYSKKSCKGRRGVIFPCPNVATSFTHEICPFVHFDYITGCWQEN